MTSAPNAAAVPLLAAVACIGIGCGEQDFLAEPKDRVTDVSVSERAAFEAQKEIQKGLCRAFDEHDAGQASAGVTPDFAIRFPEQPTSVASNPGLETRRGGGGSARVGGPAQLRALVTGWLEGVERVERCQVKNDLFLLAPALDEAYARFDWHVAGRAESGGAIERRARLSVGLRKTAKGWRIARLDAERLESDVYSGPRFRDVSPLTGIDLFRSEEKERSLLTNLGNVNVTNLGGLTVADFDDDGREDVLVYHVHSLMSLFLNDGEGGFARVATDRLPAAATAGMFYLFLDLDEDGRSELVVDYACDDRNSHIAAHDVDGDGLLDLFLSNYGLAKRDISLNHADAVDGGPNRLLRNLGGLRFEEITERAGIDASTRRTLLGEWHDFTGDGQTDLMLINDFAENELYVANGPGRFEKKSHPPLTDVGFSMGIAFADYDNDADLDVFVSNMYSYAGKRVLSITPELDDAQRARLWAMAAGNTLYENLGPGRYRNVAEALGVENANWAWGGVFFDYDNDGDRDLHVTNGMASHPNPASKRAPDN